MNHPHALVDYYQDKDASEAMASNKAVINHIQSIDPSGHCVAPILTPRPAVSCTAEILTALGDLARERGLRIQTHLSENKAEVELVKEIWPSSKSYTHVYDEFGLLTDQTILAHSIHLSAEERALIRKRDSKVSHCPVSNSTLASGMCPVRKLLDDGITVGLGTDVSGGYSSSMLEATRHACLISRLLSDQTDKASDRLSIDEALWLATRGGAKVVGWEDRIGAFEVGIQWDAQLKSLDPLSGEAGDSGAGNGRSEGNVDVFG
jgi:guanine deaminase